MGLSARVREEIENKLKDHRIVLFMKGRHGMPQCGFSARVASILDELGQDYQVVNVLESAEIREGIKEYTNWPTIPQLYVEGKFVGGCDIVSELHASGELHKILGVSLDPVDPPTLHVSDAAAMAFREALSDEGASVVRFHVDAEFRPVLDLSASASTDVEVVANGVRFAIPRPAVKKIDGTKIDFVAGPSGGFRIENPNEPPRVRQMSCSQLLEKMQSGEPFELIDVRTPEEQKMARIEGAKLLDAGLTAQIESFDRSRVLVFHCHHGGRSQAAAEHFVKRGFRNVYNLKGGIDAWALEIDNTIPRY